MESQVSSTESGTNTKRWINVAPLKMRWHIIKLDIIYFNSTSQLGRMNWPSDWSVWHLNSIAIELAAGATLSIQFKWIQCFWRPICICIGSVNNSNQLKRSLSDSLKTIIHQMKHNWVIYNSITNNNQLWNEDQLNLSEIYKILY